jgi:DNA adenine methylase
VKYHPNALKEELQYLLGSREMFFQLMNSSFLTDVQKAAQFFFLITRSFGGKGSTFGCVKKANGGACKSLRNYNLKIDAIHERLDRVMIEHRDFEKLIKQYDFEDAFFYCDPPYTCGCGYEVTSTTDFDHERLCETLKNIKGRFLLSYDDSPKVRELYKGFEMIEIERQNGINNRQGTERENKVFKELLIANYPIREFHYGRPD